MEYKSLDPADAVQAGSAARARLRDSARAGNVSESPAEHPRPSGNAVLTRLGFRVGAPKLVVGRYCSPCTHVRKSFRTGKILQETNVFSSLER